MIFFASITGRVVQQRKSSLAHTLDDVSDKDCRLIQMVVQHETRVVSQLLCTIT
jgi:hypothetical protein